jgi:hypothetical protein
MRKRKSEPERRRGLPAIDPLQRYDIAEAATYLRQSRASLYKDIKDGVLLTIKRGKRRYVPGSEIARVSALPTD